MGGFGSGRTGWRPKAEDLPALDIRDLKRRGRLVPVKIFESTWTWGSARKMSVFVTVLHGAVALSYSMDGRTISERIELTWTPCNYGGERPWFVCPSCGRRAAVLFCDTRFLCRLCNDVAYASEAGGVMDRLCRKRDNLLQLLGGKPEDFVDFVPRPAGMHRRTYRKIKDALVPLMERINSGGGSQI